MTIPASNANMKPAAKYAKKQAIPQAIQKCANYDSAKMNIIAFSGKDDIQSNFYPCNIKIFGISHPYAEHAFQYSKAMRSGDTDHCICNLKSQLGTGCQTHSNKKLPRMIGCSNGTM